MRLDLELIAEQTTTEHTQQNLFLQAKCIFLTKYLLQPNSYTELSPLNHYVLCLREITPYSLGWGNVFQRIMK